MYNMHKNNKKLKRGLALFIAIILIVTTLLMGIPVIYGASGSRAYGAARDVTDEASLKEELSFMALLIQAMRQSYKDEISYEMLVNGAYEGLFNALEDPYSMYFETEESSSKFLEDVQGEFEGVGISMENADGRCRVVTPVAGSPAEAAGIKSGDIIERVDDVELRGKSMEEWKSLIRGNIGTQVTLSIDRNGTKLNVTVTREKIRTDSVTWKMIEDTIAYVRITKFDNDTDREFRRIRQAAMEAGATSMILDLRNNPGGVVSAAAGVANLMIPGEDKIIMQMSRQGESLGTLATTGSGSAELPAVVLINGGSASASEILAGALKDHKAATLVGTTTYGKGIAQTVTELKNGGSMKLSTYYFLTPDGHVINHVGIAPDVQVINGLGLNEEQIVAEYEKLAPMTELIKYYKGQTGLNVYAAQQRLNLLGANLTVNATMDEATVEAIKVFQREQGMSPYGGLDYGTMTALERSVLALLSGDNDDKQLAKAVELLKAK